MAHTQSTTDRETLESLLHEYANAIDDGDFSRVGALFEHGAIFDGNDGEIARGARHVFAFYSELIKVYTDKSVPLTQHVISNLSISIQEDRQTGTAQANFTVLQQQDRAINTIITGRYVSMFKRFDNAWHFSEHHIKPVLVGDLSQHINLDRLKINDENI